MTSKTIAQGAEAIITLEPISKTNAPISKKSSALTNSAKKSGEADLEAINRERSESFVGESGRQGENNTPQIKKSRIKKSYRIPELDNKIRKLRTRGEAKLLTKASKIIPTPKILDAKENTKEIFMEFIDGKKLSENLDSFSLKEQKKICKQIGKSIAKLHKNGIIHGDLTTSNLIYVPEKTKTPNSKKSKSLTEFKRSVVAKPISKQLIASEASHLLGNRAGGKDLLSENFKVYFIDFGLGFHSDKIEDKAVELHLIHQALEAKHFKNWKTLLEELHKGYKSINKENAGKVFTRLKKVEKRGRYKH